MIFPINIFQRLLICNKKNNIGKILKNTVEYSKLIKIYSKKCIFSIKDINFDLFVYNNYIKIYS